MELLYFNFLLMPHGNEHPEPCMARGWVSREPGLPGGVRHCWLHGRHQ